MKHKLFLYIFLLFVIISLLSHQSKAQGFAPVGAEWHYSRYLPLVPSSSFTGYIKIKSIKDTNILSNNCKLIVETYENNSIQDSLYMYKDNFEKVFYFNSDSNRFCLLYDFNIMVGDSFELDCIIDPTNPLKNLMVYVDSVSQININGKIKNMQYYRTVVNLPGYRFLGWVIEDIGNLTFLFPTFQDGLTGPLRCYQDDSLGLYNTGASFSCSYVITGIDETKNDLDAIKIYPNLVEDNLFVINKKNKKINLIVTSVLGKEEYFFQDFTKSKLDLSKLTAGIYFITVINDKGYITTKIIKK